MPLAYDDPKNPIRHVEHALVTRAGGLQANFWVQPQLLTRLFEHAA